MSTQRYEYLLESSVSQEVAPPLLDRLQSITDTAFSDGSAFKEHERIYMLKGSGAAHVTIYCRRSLTDSSAPWQLRYLGLPETSSGQSQAGRRPVLMRSCIMSAVDGNCFNFLSELGFRVCNEHILEGHLFVKGNVTVTMARVSKSSGDGLESAQVVSPSYLVQARLLAPSGSTSAVDHLWSVADMLKPLVTVWKAH